MPLARRTPRTLGFVALAALPLAVLAIFFFLPLGGMLKHGLWQDGNWSLEQKAMRLVLTLSPLFNPCAFADAATLYCSKPSAVQLRPECVAILVRVPKEEQS